MKLKPCPFCGCSVTIVPTGNQGQGDVDGKHDVDCILYGVDIYGNAKEWNRRQK